MGEKLNVRVEFKEEMIQKFEAVKKYLGLEINAEVLRLLVSDKFKEIQDEARSFAAIAQAKEV